MNSVLQQKKWQNWLISQLRRTSYKWAERTKAKSRGRIERGIYRCNMCGGEFKAANIQLDHIVPVIDVSRGFVDWDTLINRLFCDAAGYQVLCRPCHTEKTNLENSKRREVKKHGDENSTGEPTGT